MNSVLQFLSQTAKIFNSLSPARKLSMVVVVAVVMTGIAVFVFSVNHKEYTTLFSGLSTEDAGRIVTRLQEKKIPYKVSRSGDTVSVPEEHISETRLDLAASGLPGGSGVGFEIFDNKSFGVTSFVQQLDYQRALQGELARTINGLDEVHQSRVHIVIPKQSLFTEDQVKPTASVIIKPKTGRKLRPSQVEGIVALVSSSVEGLSPEGVMVVDSSGNILSTAKAKDASPFSERASSRMEYQRNIEKDLAVRIQSMLEKVVGEGKVVAKVSATVDFKVVEKTEESYDPEEPVVRSMRRNSKKSGVSAEGGESSVTPSDDGEFKAAGTGLEETNEVVNYEINRVVSKTVMPVGEVEKLSVAVLVDGIYGKNGEGAEEFQPRSKEEIKALEGLVKKSIGFDASRGDQVAVTSIPFRKMDAAAVLPEEGGFKTVLYVALPYIKHIVSLVILIAVLFFLLRPLIKFISAADKDGGRNIKRLTSAGGEPGAGALELRGVDGLKDLAKQDAREFAELLKTWLQ
jgi:flagellar M-ring protein FliF